MTNLLLTSIEPNAPDKFWNCKIDSKNESVINFHYGKVNFNGTHKNKSFTNRKDAIKYMTEMVLKKKKKGYFEKPSVGDEMKRKAKFYNFSEEITPYYSIEGRIIRDIEYYAYLIGIREKNEQIIRVSPLKQDEIVDSILHTRISCFINDSKNNVRHGDIVFTGIYSRENDDDIQNYMNVAVKDENSPIKLVHFSGINKQNVDYSEICDKIIEFCTEQMEACNEDFIYDDPPSGYFDALYKFMECV